jgi:predicted ferric reductase
MVTVASTLPGAARRRRSDGDGVWIVSVVVIVNAVVLIGMWLRHGQLQADVGPGGLATGVGQLSALAGSYLCLFGLLLSARVPWLERALGFGHLLVWHRWTGFAALWLLVAHVCFTTVGYAQGSGVSLWAQTDDFVRHYPDVLMAFVGIGLLIAVGVTSARLARRRLPRESWYAVHVYAYLAVVLGFAHQLAVGSDFTDDAIARAWWAALYVAVLSAILVCRVGMPVAFNLRHRLRVATVHVEAPGVVSIWITGRDIPAIAARPGQFFLWRTLDRQGWWRPIPLSLSAPPGSSHLRVTVKALGDDTARLQHVRPGTPMFAEGPLGAFTPDRRRGESVLLIAGGIGITPLRAMLDDLAAGAGDVIVLYRVAAAPDAALWKELAAANELPNVTARLLVGPEIGNDETDRLGIPALRAEVPDLAGRDVYVCGPVAMIDAVVPRLRNLGVPPQHIHLERFEY